MTKNSWPPEDRAEYDELLAAVVASSTDTSERLDEFERLIEDAKQAQRFWARDIERECARDGYASEIRRYLNRHRASVSHKGRILNLPKIQSRTTRREDGTIGHERTLLETWTWDDIERKRASYVATIAASRDEIAYLDRLLGLRERCPASSGPAEAIALLGLAMDEYLQEEDAA